MNFWLPVWGQAEVDYCQQASNLVKTVQKFHYKPAPFDTDFRELVFKRYIKLLDPENIYLSGADINKLKGIYCTDEFSDPETCLTLELSVALYKKGLHIADSVIHSFQHEDILFTESSSIEFGHEILYLSRQELIERLEKVLKYNILAFASEESSDITLPVIRRTLCKRAINSELCLIKSRLGTDEQIAEYVGSAFLKALAVTFDPNTNYLSIKGESEFSKMLAKKTYAFGFDIERNEFGEIAVSYIVPGGPAWKSNSINEGDIILGVQTKEISHRFNCVSLREVTEALLYDESTQVTIQLRKKGGRELNVKLTNVIIDVPDNIINSFILDGDIKIGYIYLPSFYAQTDNKSYTYNGCANDVAKELLRLRQEGIHGLILDLRNNGGGYMSEASLLTGSFINYGAIAIHHSKNSDPRTIKDMNRGTVFQKPLVVLVNEFSASASEFLAGALQDQNRAVIVGSKTYGKATSQQTIPIDAYRYANVMDYKHNAPAYIKLTTGCFYRVTGKTHQGEGIIPDIILPSIFDSISTGESRKATSLLLMPIEKKTYYYPLPQLPIEELKESSQTRIGQDSAFIKIQKLSEILKKQYNNRTFVLTPDSYFSVNTTFSEYDISEKSNGCYTVNNPEYIKGLGSIEDSTKEIHEDLMLRIHEDVYIGEAYHIISDLINLKKQLK